MKLDQGAMARTLSGEPTRLGEPDGLTKARRTMALIALLAGSVLILGDAWFVHHVHLDEAIFRRATAQGVVVELKWVPRAAGSSSKSPTGYAAVARFRAQSGQTLTLDDWMLQNPPLFTRGQVVTVFYDPQQPDNAVIDHGGYTYLLAGMPMGMGLLALLGGVQGLLKARQPSQT